MRSACSVASVPEFVKRTISADGSTPAQPLGQPQLEIARSTEDDRPGALDLGADGVEHARMPVAGDQRAEREAIVHVLAPVHVDDTRSLRPRQIDRVRRKELDVRGDAGRQAG